MLHARGTVSKLFVLSALYFMQGLPYGFQTGVLAVLLREEGASLTAIGLASLLSLPWMIKAIWGPFVDRLGSERFGRRRSWIVPLQSALVACVALLIFVPPERLPLMVVLVLAMNLCASTMDVAVDGLAIDLLRRDELGYGNIAQVVGYKVGILTSSGILLAFNDVIGWSGQFVGMAVLMLLVLGVTLAFREPPRSGVAVVVESGDAAASAGVPGEVAVRSGMLPDLRSVLRLLWQALRLPGTVWLLLFIASYKFGESLADVMFRPFLIDAGISAAQIGIWVGTWGTVFSIAGSVTGGILASRLPLITAVGWTAFLRMLSVAGEWWLTQIEVTPTAVITVTCAEHFFGGALTTAMFAFMMSRVDRRIGATHFTVLATVEVGGKGVAGVVSGVLADKFGYADVFALATVLCAAFLLLLVPLSKAQRAEMRS